MVMLHETSSHRYLDLLVALKLTCGLADRQKGRLTDRQTANMVSIVMFCAVIYREGKCSDVCWSAVYYSVMQCAWQVKCIGTQSIAV
jgi:hypothetical protein